MKLTYTYLIFLILSLFTLSCKNKEDASLPGGETQIKLQLSIDDFSNDLVNGKIASSFSYMPAQINYIDLNQDFILEAEIRPYYDKNELSSQSKILQSNKKLAATDLSNGTSYRLLVYDSNTNALVAMQDYIRGNETNEDPIKLLRNKTYTIIVYSLNTNLKSDLEDILYLGSTASPTLEALLATSTLTNTSLKVEGNPDLLFYKDNYTTQDLASQNLNILLKHQFNLLSATIDVSSSGYSINAIEAILSTTKNEITLPFNSSTATYQNNSAEISLPNFTYSTSTSANVVPGVVNSIATSDPVIINTPSGQNLLKITTLKIGDITNPGTITPFIRAGVSLTPGYKYNLSVRIIPRDSLYTVDVTENSITKTYPVARINGQIWMRHNLGADYSSDPDVAQTGFLGDYYQWGQNISVANGFSTGGSGDVQNWRYNTTVNQALFDRWNRPSANTKGPYDPCPANFRIPTTAEYQNLIAATSFNGYIGTIGENTYAMQLVSKRKSTVLLTFPTQGYINVAGSNTGTSWNAAGVVYRGREADLKTITYTQSSINGIPTLLYELFENKSATTGPHIYGLNGTGYNSTGNPAIGNTVRCIAINANQFFSINDRVIDTSIGEGGF